MNTFLDEALKLKNTLIEWRRFLHQNAELTDNLPVTSNFVKTNLENMGYNVDDCYKCGLTSTLGNKNSKKVLLVRADMDALPMMEDNELPFKSSTKYSHCCGHDIHTTVLLGVAKILKEHEDMLDGCVKFMFQPDEETGHGAKGMIDSGILKNPDVNAAFALHVDALEPMGKINYGLGCTFASNDNIDIIIKGKSSHGARPHEGIDCINIAFHIYSLFQSYLTREKNPMDTVIFSITSINAGNAYNIIPDTACLKATLRTYNMDVRDKTMNKFRKIIKNMAELYDTEITLEINDNFPPLITDEDMSKTWVSYIKECLGEEHVGRKVVKMGSEDFAYVAETIPSAYFFLGAGKNSEEGFNFGQHTTKVIFNEDCIPYGVAFVVYSIIKWLKNN